MSKVFRAKLKDLLKAKDMLHRIDPMAWQQAFNVNSQHVSSSHQSIKYLAPYVFKVAITNARIIKVEGSNVIFKYKKSKSNRWRSMSLPVMEFIRRFLQHVLPAGFMKVRYYGFMGAKPRVSRQEVRALIELAFGFEIQDSYREKPHTMAATCPECGSRMVLRYVMARLFGPGKGAG